MLDAGRNSRQLLESVAGKAGDDEIGKSVVTLLELAHCVVRADTTELARNASASLLPSWDEVIIVPPYPLTVSAALRAGRIDRENPAKGLRIRLSDLLIAVTAL
jgi:predicted nucleic acid-binding protein